MKDIQERIVFHVNGWAMVLVDLAAIVLSFGYIISHAAHSGPTVGLVAACLILVLVFLTFGGFFIIHPNESKVFTFLGRYIGSARTAGFYFTNPFAVKKKVTLRIFNFNSETIKVNDALGNPIEIAAVVVWHVEDTAQAIFDVDDFEAYVDLQSETALRHLATAFVLTDPRDPLRPSS